MFYRLDENGKIKDNANFRYAEDCLETDKNIVRGFDGKLVFEEEVQTQEYLKLKQEFETKQNNQKRIAEIKQRLEELNKDFIQAMLGAIIPNIEDKKIEFMSLHNELRGLLGQEPREYVKEE